MVHDQCSSQSQVSLSPQAACNFPETALIVFSTYAGHNHENFSVQVVKKCEKYIKDQDQIHQKHYVKVFSTKKQKRSYWWSTILAPTTENDNPTHIILILALWTSWQFSNKPEKPNKSFMSNRSVLTNSDTCVFGKEQTWKILNFPTMRMIMNLNLVARSLLLELKSLIQWKNAVVVSPYNQHILKNEHAQRKQRLIKRLLSRDL